MNYWIFGIAAFIIIDSIILSSIVHFNSKQH